MCKIFDNSSGARLNTVQHELTPDFKMVSLLFWHLILGVLYNMFSHLLILHACYFLFTHTVKYYALTLS